MASMAESIYFPPLDRCLSREVQLLSWKAVYDALCNASNTPVPTCVRDFLSDDTSVELLSQSLDPFRTSSPQSKSAFQTKTAAINVTQSANADYDITDLKADATWLSDQAWIDELAALRFVILEHQSRSSTQLLSGFSEEEIISATDAVGGAGLGASLLRPRLADLKDNSATTGNSAAAFASKERRRFRLLNLFLSEKSHILRISDIATRAHVYKSHSPLSIRAGPPEKWLAEVGSRVFRTQDEQEKETFVDSCILAVQRRFEKLEKGSGWYEPEGGNLEMEEAFGTFLWHDLVHVLRLMFTHLDNSNDLPLSKTVLNWFRFAAKASFFVEIYPPFPSQQWLASSFQAMFATVSLVLLKLPRTIDYMESVSSLTEAERGHITYITDPKCVGEINAIFLDLLQSGATPATPAIFAWCLIITYLRDYATVYRNDREAQLMIEDDTPQTGRRGSSVQRPSLFEEALELIYDNDLDEDAILFMARSVVDKCGVYDLVPDITREITLALSSCLDSSLEVHVRLVYLELVREGLFQTRYDSDVILATLSLLRPFGRDWQTFDHSHATSSDLVLKEFLQDHNGFMAQLLDQAVLRYPYETGAFVKFFTALSSQTEINEDGTLKTIASLQRIATLTQVLPTDFRAYSLIREDESSNYIELSEDLPLFPMPTTMQRLIGNGKSTEKMIIRRGTEGHVNGDVKPLITTWDFPHSAIRYLTHDLQTFIDTAGHRKPRKIRRENPADIVKLFSTLLNASILADTDNGGPSKPDSISRRFLDHASDGLGNQDLVMIIFAIFEQELQRLRLNSAGEDPCELLVNCVHFIHALVAIVPSRVWPFLRRSKLLEVDGDGGALASIIAASEMVRGRYDLSISCCRLWQSLIENSITHAARTDETNPRGAISKLGSTDAEALRGSPIRDMAETLLAFTKVMSSLFQGTPEMKFQAPEEQQEINIGILKTFNSILELVYGFDDAQAPSEKLTRALVPSANSLATIFLSESSDELAMRPILAMFTTAAQASLSTLDSGRKEAILTQTRYALTFASTVLRLAPLVGRSSKHLEQKLFQTCPILARVYAADASYRSPISQLLQIMVQTAAHGPSRPPSLLGHFGHDTSRCFLTVLSSLDRPFDDPETERSIWQFLSAVVSCKQQWLSIYLLTGNTPRESLTNGEKAAATSAAPPAGRSLLNAALDRLSNLWKSDFDTAMALPMLEFIALAQSYWPWAMQDLRNHQDFFKGITNFLSTLVSSDNRPKSNQTLESCKRLQLARYVTEILAMYLRHARQIKDQSTLKQLLPALGFLREYGVAVPFYNSSLHSSLSRNLTAKYPSCSLLDFKRTPLIPRTFGDNYFYDIDYAKMVLGFDTAWKGRGTRGDQGFASEFKLANLNLSLVEAQVDLTKSWKLLAIELSNLIHHEPKLAKTLAGVVEACVKANTETTRPEELFQRLIHVRADLAFVLVQRLIDSKVGGAEIQSLLFVTWDAICSLGQDSENLYTGEIADYYRVLLKILLLSLQPHLTASTPSPSKGDSSNPADAFLAPRLRSTILAILTNVISTGFRSLCAHLHAPSPSATVSPSDFVLLTSLLQTILNVPHIHTIHSDIALLFANANTPRYALTLFSWSHQLTPQNDPIFGELSLVFLLALTSIPLLAESLATENVLADLNAATLADYYRRPSGSGPFDDPTRMHSIWTRALLPLCLNLLHALDAPIAPEIAAFLNGFPAQLARCADDIGRGLLPSQPRVGAFSTASSSSATTPGPKSGHITLNLASEIHSLSLLHLVITRLRASGAAAVGGRGDEIPVLEWDASRVRVDVEGWLQGRRAVLRGRIVAVSESDAALGAGSGNGASSREDNGGDRAESRLEERVVGELRAALECLNAASSAASASGPSAVDRGGGGSK